MKVNAVMRIDFNQLLRDEPNFLTGCWGCQSGYVYLKSSRAPTSVSSKAQKPRGRSATSPTNPTAACGTTTATRRIGTSSTFRRPPRPGAGWGDDPRQRPELDRDLRDYRALILGMAVVNFTNFATARASQRAREVALRKVLGATRRQLIVQFVTANPS